MSSLDTLVFQQIQLSQNGRLLFTVPRKGLQTHEFRSGRNTIIVPATWVGVSAQELITFFERDPDQDHSKPLLAGLKVYYAHFVTYGNARGHSIDITFADYMSDQLEMLNPGYSDNQ